MKMTKDLSDKIFRALRRYYPDVTPDLRYRNLYQLAVAVVLSAQTTDRQVNSVTGDLFGAYTDFQELARARLADVRKIIRSTGFYRNKAKISSSSPKRSLKNTAAGCPAPERTSRGSPASEENQRMSSSPWALTSRPLPWTRIS